LIQVPAGTDPVLAMHLTDGRKYCAVPKPCFMPTNVPAFSACAGFLPATVRATRANGH
jgi:hypothetical protein